MRRSLEHLGWGSGLQDPAALAVEADAARILAFWAFLTACSTRTLGLAVNGVFDRPETPLSGATGALVRLLSLLERLLTVEIPALTRSVRVETEHTGEWMRNPIGGRIDAAASLRASAGELPEMWLVRRTERRIDTPVNLFVAAVLRAAATRIERVAGLYRVRGLAVPELIAAADVALQRFFRDHFLGRVGVPSGTPPEAYRQAAARRRSEFGRIRTLVGWWDEVQQVELQALQLAFAGGTALDDLDVHASYEMAVAFALVCALERRWRCTPDSSAGDLRFLGRDGQATLYLGPADPTGLEGRGLTARLDLLRTSGEASTWLVEARHARASVAKPHLSHLTLACRTVGGTCEGLLITPGPVGATPPALPVQWIEMNVTSDLTGLVGSWSDLLTVMIMRQRPRKEHE